MRKPATQQPRPKAVASSAGLGDALRITIRIAEEYSRLCSVMHSMPYRRSEYEAGEKLMDALENLRDEILKRKSSNDPSSATGGRE